MTYDPSIPTDLPPPNVAVDKIRTNFSQYASVFDNNHVALNANNQGQHSNVLLQGQSSDPTVSGNFDSLYSKSITTNSSTSQELFLRIPKFLPDKNNTPMQLTFNSVNTAGPVYQSFMAGGYIVYFGETNNIAVPITLSPKPLKILCVIANGNKFTTVGTPVPYDAQVVVNANNFQFTITSLNASGVYRFSWFAIGSQ